MCENMDPGLEEMLESVESGLEEIEEMEVIAACSCAFKPVFEAILDIW